MALCWLYCPDAVIHKAYNFLDHVHTGVKKSDEEKEQALGTFVLAVRKDLPARETVVEEDQAQCSRLP